MSKKESKPSRMDQLKKYFENHLASRNKPQKTQSPISEIERLEQMAKNLESAATIFTKSKPKGPLEKLATELAQTLDQASQKVDNNPEDRIKLLQAAAQLQSATENLNQHTKPTKQEAAPDAQEPKEQSTEDIQQAANESYKHLINGRVDMAAEAAQSLSQDEKQIIYDTAVTKLYGEDKEAMDLYKQLADIRSKATDNPKECYRELVGGENPLMVSLYHLCSKYKGIGNDTLEQQVVMNVISSLGENDTDITVTKITEAIDTIAKSITPIQLAVAIDTALYDFAEKTGLNQEQLGSFEESLQRQADRNNPQQEAGEYDPAPDTQEKPTTPAPMTQEEQKKAREDAQEKLKLEKKTAISTRRGI